MVSEAFSEWIQSVATGAPTMSQRNLRWVDANGGLDSLIRAAKKQSVHLVQLTDDKGNCLLAASREPFTTLC